ncbi:MAG: nucleotidyltransferase domain-containing protein [Solirubrobacterales bacterium]
MGADPPAVRRQSREKIARIASAHGASNVRVFGSAARGNVDAHDLDLLVEMGEGRSLFDLIALSDELALALGVDVDVLRLSDRGLSPYLRDRILSEAVPL